MVGKARSFSDNAKDTVYQKEFDDEVYAAAAQQNSYNLGSVHFSDQSGIANISQAGSDQRKANLEGALFRGNIGFDLQTALLDTGTDTIDLLEDGASVALSLVSTDRIVSLSSGTTADLVTILGSQRPGQRLVLYGIQGNTITIKNTAAATDNTILTPDGNDFTLADTAVALLVFDITTVKWRVLTGGSGGGTGTGTFISAALSADQTTNIAVSDHIEFDTNTPPTGADGLIVLQTGAGQLDGIFELISGKTYFLTSAVNPLFSAVNDVEVVWFDITNATELGRRTKIDSATLAMNQPKNEIIFTPTTDVTVEVRIVSVTTPANLTGFDALYSFASIFEFSGQAGADGADGAPTWKLPARSKSTADVASLAAFTVLNDGVTLVEDDRVLLTNQTTLSENGLYQVGVVAAGVAPLTRPTDFDTSAEVLAECFVAIEEGTTFENQLYHLISDNPLTIDVSSQVWEEFAPGTSGGPDLGGGADGIDGAGFFVNDGRIAVGTALLKNWEQIDNFTYPDNGPNHLLYMQGVFSPFAQGRVIMTGDSNNTRGAVFSDNFGTTWTLSTGITGNDNMVKLAFDPVASVLVAVANNAPNVARAIRRSTDRGTSFAATSYAGSLSIQDVIWSPADSLFVLVDSTATTTDRVWTSPDGDTWTQRTTPAAVIGGWTKIAFNSVLGLYVVLGNSATDVMTSPDAITWTIGVTNISVNFVTRLIASPGQKKFVAVASVLPGPVGTSFISEDGINWTSNAITGAQSINDVVYAPDLSMYLAIGQEASNVNPQIFWFSNDAINWFQTPENRMRKGGSLGTTFSKISVAYSQEYGIFFGCCGQSTVSNPFTANARFWRTEAEFNDAIG